MNRLLLFMAKLLVPSNKVDQTLGPAADQGGAGASGSSVYDQTDIKITSIADFAGTLQLLLRKILGPELMIIGVFAVVYAIYLGVQYAKAEDSGKRKETQGRLIGPIIGAVIIVAAATLCLAIDWSDLYFSMQDKHTFADINGDSWCDYCGHNSSHKFHG